jgi:hypothetical protein
MCDGGNLHSMQSSTQVYRALKGAEFSDTQARALVQILQAAGLVEPEAPESELERIEQYLMAEPFEPFLIEMAGGKSYRIERRDQCGFSRHGSVQLQGVGETQWALLNSINIVRVKKL